MLNLVVRIVTIGP